MIPEPFTKYRPFPPIHLPDRQWPNRVLTSAPIWCSVDLRDGNQALAVPMNVSQKLEMFDALVQCGFKEIEVGFPAASNTEYEFMRRLIDGDRIPQDVTVQVLVQAREDLIERTVESLAGARRVIIHMYNSTSPAQRRVVFGLDKAAIVRMAANGTRFIKERLPRLAGTDVHFQYSPESFSATEVEFALEICEAVCDVWQPTPERKIILNLPDTVEVAMPNIYADQIEWFCRNLRRRDCAIISLHTHNDRGTGVAATELGLLAGADRVEGTLFGNGERTGNLDIVIVAMNLYMHGIRPELDFGKINDLITMYERCTGMTVPPRQPYAGELVFTAFSGSHQDAIKKGLAEWARGARTHWDVPYLAIDPNDIGREYREVIRVNSQSGKGGAAYLIESELGVDLPKEFQREFGPISNEHVDKLGREVSPAELKQLFVSEYIDREVPWKLGNFVNRSSAGSAECEAEVDELGTRKNVKGAGESVLAAFTNALGEVWGAGMPSFKVAEHHEGRSRLSAGSEHIAFVQVKFATGRSAYGAAMNVDTARASIQALLNALNRAYPWCLLESASSMVLPGGLRVEFGNLATRMMRDAGHRLAPGNLEELFLNEFARREDRFAFQSAEPVVDPGATVPAYDFEVLELPSETGSNRKVSRRFRADGATALAAFVKGLGKLCGLGVQVLEFSDYAEHPIARGKSATVAYLQLRFPDGRTSWGAAIEERRDNAAIKAALAAVNRHLAGRAPSAEALKVLKVRKTEHPFPFNEFEPKWQQVWEKEQTFHALNPGESRFNRAQPKYYVLDMFPYPSGAGLHVGHPEGYTATDIIARYKRMRGFNVLHPMGWDAFGLPAEQYAIKTGQHPAITTAQNIERFKSQLKRIGFAYDWQREVNTTDPGYFRWTQWIFLQLYRSWFNPVTRCAEPISTYSGADPDSVRLAYVSEAPVNWCPELGTVLANEEVIDGKSEVGGHPVERRPMRQWMLRITAYAQRLIDELDGLDWPESIKTLQRNWIGRSDGAEVHFQVAESNETITVFTTRPDTLYGATYMVLAPEHRLVEELTTEEQCLAVEAYRERTARKSDLERTELAKEKSGVFTGAHAINPVNGERIPIWIADYVLLGYGTGAIMAVPAHDERDWEFAQKFSLPIRQVVSPNRPASAADFASPPSECFVGEGCAVQSGPLDGLTTAEAKVEISRRLEQSGQGKTTIHYKLRDWLFSRQRYWGEPFPIVWENGRHRVLDENELPVEPPKLEDFKPTGTPEPPLSRAKEWIRYSEGVTRETNTMPQWAGSCWYYLRYCDASNPQQFVGPDAERYWMTGTVDNVSSVPSGSPLAEARSKISFLSPRGTSGERTEERFPRSHSRIEPLNQPHALFSLSSSVEERAGVRSRFSFRFMERGNRGGVDLYVGGTEHAVLHLLYARFWHKVLFDLGHVSTPEPFQRLVNQGLILGEDGQKMSKSRGNVVNPDDVIAQYGADAFRCYEMFMGPLEASKPWSTRGVEGVFRFLARVWRLVVEQSESGETALSAQLTNDPPDRDLNKVIHSTIKKVGVDIENLSFNTAIAQMMVCTNALTQAPQRPRSAIKVLLQMANPFAPHLTEELWERLGFNRELGLLARQSWPEFDPALLIEDEIEMPVQVNGKLRDVIRVPANATQAEVEAAALGAAKAKSFLEGKTVKKIILVPRKLVNIVVCG